MLKLFKRLLSLWTNDYRIIPMSKTNYFRAQGTVVRIKKASENMLTFSVKTTVERVNDWGVKEPREAYVNFKAFGDLIAPIEAQIKIGRGIKVEAEVMDGSYIDKTTNERMYTTDVIVQSFEFAPERN